MSSTDRSTAKMREQVLAQVTAQLLDAHRSGIEMDDLDGTLRLDTISEAYKVQRMVAADLGEVAAWKVSLDRAAVLHRAAIPVSKILSSPARFSLGKRTHAYIEAEIAFRLGRSMPAGRLPHDREAAYAAIESCHLAFELICSRFSTPLAQLSPFHLLADCGGTEAIVVGDAIHLALLERRDSIGVTMTRGDTVFASSTRCAHDPVDLLMRLANHLNEHGDMLHDGDIVMTGAICYAPAELGDLAAQIDGAGVRLNLTRERAE